MSLKAVWHINLVSGMEMLQREALFGREMEGRKEGMEGGREALRKGGKEGERGSKRGKRRRKGRERWTHL